MHQAPQVSAKRIRNHSFLHETKLLLQLARQFAEPRVHLFQFVLHRLFVRHFGSFENQNSTNGYNKRSALRTLFVFTHWWLILLLSNSKIIGKCALCAMEKTSQRTMRARIFITRFLEAQVTHNNDYLLCISLMHCGHEFYGRFWNKNDISLFPS